MKIVYRKDGEFPPREVEVIGAVTIFPDSVRFYKKDTPGHLEEVPIECVYEVHE